MNSCAIACSNSLQTASNINLLKEIFSTSLPQDFKHEAVLGWSKLIIIFNSSFLYKVLCSFSPRFSWATEKPEFLFNAFFPEVFFACLFESSSSEKVICASLDGDKPLVFLPILISSSEETETPWPSIKESIFSSSHF